MHSLYAHWAANLPKWCQKLSDVVTLYTPRNHALMGASCLDGSVPVLTFNSLKHQGTLITASLSHKMTSDSIAISKVPMIQYFKYNQWVAYPIIVALKSHNRAAIPPERVLRSQIFFFIDGGRASSKVSWLKITGLQTPVLPLKVCCVLNEKRGQDGSTELIN